MEGTEDEFPENVIDSRRWTKEKERRKTTKVEGELEISLVPRRRKCRPEVPNFFPCSLETVLKRRRDGLYFKVRKMELSFLTQLLPEASR